MPAYRIHYLKESLRSQFRTMPHTSGRSAVRPKDYEPGEQVEASSPYALWHLQKGAVRPVQVGDVLEQQDGELKIYKFIGFEEAFWALPEPKPVPEPAVQDGSPVPAG